MPKKIPFVRAKELAKEYGYDQVVVLARKVEEPEHPGGWSACSYGKNRSHCQVAGRIVDVFAGLESGDLKICKNR